MSFYTDKAALADRLLRKYGTSATLTDPGTPTYDPNTGGTTQTPLSQTVTVAVFDYDEKFIDGSLILRGDKQVYMSARGVTAPKAGNTLTLGGAVFTVIASKPLAPALLAVLFELQVRG